MSTGAHDAPARPGAAPGASGAAAVGQRTVRAGWWLAALAAVTALAAPWCALHPPGRQHRDFVYAPPVPVRVVDADGRWRAPFVHPLVLVDRLERRFEEDRSQPVPVLSALGGIPRRPTLAPDATPPDPPPEEEGTARPAVPTAPVVADAGSGRERRQESRPDPAGDLAGWFPLGTDSLGRDVWSRLAAGTRNSLGVAALACAGALALGLLVGAVAGLDRGWVDELLMRLAELVLVLPALYVVLALRASLPLVLSTPMLFLLLSLVLALAGWPTVARGVRAIVRREAASDYAAAARAIGCTRARLVVRHLLPATAPFLATQVLLLVPAFVLAEATLSYVGLGFNPPAASWGSMLQEAANVRAVADFPWVLAPAAAIVLVSLVINAVTRER